MTPAPFALAKVSRVNLYWRRGWIQSFGHTQPWQVWPAMFDPIGLHGGDPVPVLMPVSIRVSLPHRVELAGIGDTLQPVNAGVVESDS